MKSKLFLASFVGLVICFSCKKQTIEPVTEPEQKVFENLPSCCKKGDICNYPIELKNLTGKLYAGFVDNNGKLIYLTIFPDIRPLVSDSILPLFSVYSDAFNICNMPEKLINSNTAHKVKFDCKFFYWDVKRNPDGTVPQRTGYPTELTRIEILD